MDQEIVKAAISTFCAVPEVYQQAFKELGADFPDDLVKAVKTKPEEAMKVIQQDEGLMKGIISIYQQYGDQINQAASQQQQGMFKEGGKLNYLLKKYHR